MIHALLSLPELLPLAEYPQLLRNASLHAQTGCVAWKKGNTQSRVLGASRLQQFACTNYYCVAWKKGSARS
eukprot:1160367-Pelagomonas_calceolata.AAC.8